VESLRSTFRVIGDVTSLGGTARIRHWTERQRDLLELYHRICADIDSENIGLLGAVAELRQGISSATKLLRNAAKMLDPVGQGQRALNSVTRMNTNGLPNNSITRKGTSGDSTWKELAITAAGLGVGTGTAFASWGAVQLLAHASTGTAMAVLHGAAAANAGWAWFGGGALAAGGGGMALGHIIFPGIGTAAAIAVSSVLSHTEANKLSEVCKEVETATSANQRTLAKLKSNVGKVREWERRLEAEYEVLKNAVREARRRLFPLGFISRLWRLCRVWFGGEYYQLNDKCFVDRLDSAVIRFLDAFQNV
jgi:hypothetical protein